LFYSRYSATVTVLWFWLLTTWRRHYLYKYKFAQYPSLPNLLLTKPNLTCALCVHANLTLRGCASANLTLRGCASANLTLQGCVSINLTLRGCTHHCRMRALVGQTCTVDELALGKLDWANLNWVKDRRPKNLCIFCKILDHLLCVPLLTKCT